jgi:hypothetical protein
VLLHHSEVDGLLEAYVPAVFVDARNNQLWLSSLGIAASQQVPSQPKQQGTQFTIY